MILTQVKLTRSIIHHEDNEALEHHCTTALHRARPWMTCCQVKTDTGIYPFMMSFSLSLSLSYFPLSVSLSLSLSLSLSVSPTLFTAKTASLSHPCPGRTIAVYVYSTTTII